MNPGLELRRPEGSRDRRRMEGSADVADVGDTGQIQLDLRPIDGRTPRELARELDDAMPGVHEEAGDEDVVLVRADAAPVPLYDVLDDRGLSYEAIRRGPDEWHVAVTATSIDGPSGERRQPSLTAPSSR